jgi:hypothetical protein
MRLESIDAGYREESHKTMLYNPPLDAANEKAPVRVSAPAVGF